ncbi:MAG: hypothetical protein Q9165_008488 [Trypethelium subeluteriae]
MTPELESESHELGSTTHTGADDIARLNDVQISQIPDAAGSFPSSNEIKGIKFILLITLFLIAVFLFEVGSLVCGVSPSSTAFVVGRAVAGLGAAGIFTGATTAVAQVASMKWRPLILGLVGGLYVPIGAFTIAGTVLVLRVDQKADKVSGSLLQRIMQFDPVGNLLFIVSVICLLLAVEWASTSYGWSDGRTITLFVIFGIGAIAFVSTQIILKRNATVPSRVAGQRTVAFAALFAFCISSAVFVVIYYLAVWFQAVEGLSPIMSAVHTLPMIISQLMGTFIAAGLTTRFGHYMPFVFASTIMLSIGAGLLTTFYVGISPAKWIGYQVALGLGIGFGFQQPNLAVQAALPLADVPTGTALVFTAQFLGGSVLLAAAQNTFETQLRSNVAALNLPGFNATAVGNTGASALHSVIPPQYLPKVLAAYNDALTRVFRIALIMGCLTVVGASGMEWRNVRKDKTVLTKEEKDVSHETSEQ